jgi:hypothetical protein
MSTHAIQSELIDRIVAALGLSKHQTNPRHAADIKEIIEELNRERDWVVISVLHPGRLVEMADDPLAKLAWENLDEIADRVHNNQQYDDALDLAITEEWEKFLEEQR